MSTRQDTIEERLTSLEEKLTSLQVRQPALVVFQSLYRDCVRKRFHSILVFNMTVFFYIQCVFGKLDLVINSIGL